MPKKFSCFLSHPTAQFYDREVSHETKLSRAGTNVALRQLAEAGLLLQEKRGRMMYYSLEAHSPFIRSLKRTQTLARLLPLIDALKGDALRIVLYGSAAAGEDHEESDRDLFILARHKKTLEKKVYPFLFPDNIQPVIMTPQEWAKLEMANPVFCAAVEKGIVLWEYHES